MAPRTPKSSPAEGGLQPADPAPDTSTPEVKAYRGEHLKVDEGIFLSAGMDSDIRLQREIGDPLTGNRLVLDDDGRVHVKDVADRPTTEAPADSAAPEAPADSAAPEA